MKNILLLIALFVATVAQAQQLQEVVYLKNGSIIRGTIIEQVPNESLKIKTADGSVFAYPMDEVEKITKEEFVQQKKQKENNTISIYDVLPQGYRGFVEFEGSIGLGEYKDDRLGLTTSHGYQFFPYLFVGAGAGIQYFLDSEYIRIPVFVHTRLSIPDNSRFQPFFDLKIGYTFLNYGGFYLFPAIGCRFAFAGTKGASLGVGYSLQECGRRSKENYGAITIKVGFDF